MNPRIIYVVDAAIEPMEDGGGDQFTVGIYKTATGALKALHKTMDEYYFSELRHTFSTLTNNFGTVFVATVWDEDYEDYPRAYLAITPMPLED